MPTTRSLWQAYRQASYQVSAAGEFKLVRPGCHHPFLDDLLSQFGVGTWTIATACNPRSMRLSVSENAQRQQSLEATCDRKGLRHLPARGGDGSDGWGWEESCLVLGLLRAESLALGRRYGQNAILFGQRHGPALLLDCWSVRRPEHTTQLKEQRK